MDLRQQLQATFGSAFTIERELGGGGMSRVFVALDAELGRRVVVKVLLPDLAAAVSMSRFRREIRLGAQLQHPHIVPVLSAGESDGLPYFTMPLVEGESLRSRISREGELPVEDALSILRDVARGLAYAHRHGVVHRDIKPDNILLTDDAALVTDFGVARALEASTLGGDQLTTHGVTLGTPAYMAPEQASADPGTDHRADIYAFGCVAYEMLTGRPPFAGRSAQQLIAAHMMEVATPVAHLRPSVPAELARLIARCLEKRPADRPQSAGELLQAIDAIATTPVERIAPLPASAGGHLSQQRIFAIYVASTAAVIATAWAAVRLLDVPYWVLPGAVIVMLAGLPVLVLTALSHWATPQPHSSRYTAPRSGVAARLSGVLHVPWLTWRRATIGGALAVTGFTSIVIAYSLMRVAGIGPAGSLMASGLMSSREPILVADFRGPHNDSQLGDVVAEAFRTDLSQSSSVTVIQPASLREVLLRMGREDAERIDAALAREIAERARIGVIVEGEVAAIGLGYVISARLISSETGEALAAFRETARDADALIPAIGRLSKKLRGRIGESLRSVRASPRVEQVTTHSLEAFRKYTQAQHALANRADYITAAALLREAVALDSGFGMAWRKIGIVSVNSFDAISRRNEAFSQAYAWRDRMTELERQLTTAAYHHHVRHDVAAALGAYEAALEIDSRDLTALNNASLSYMRAGDADRALEYLQRAIDTDSTIFVAHQNIVLAYNLRGDTAAATRALELMQRRFPDNPMTVVTRWLLAVDSDDYDAADSLITGVLQRFSSSSIWRANAAMVHGVSAAVRGRLREMERFASERAAHNRARGFEGSELEAELVKAWADVWYRGQPQSAVARLDAALAAYPLQQIPLYDRPYLQIIHILAEAGQPQRARQVLEEWMAEAASSDGVPRPYAQRARGLIALADERPGDAVTAFAESASPECQTCILPDLARAHEAAGLTDQAVELYERYVRSRDPERWRSTGDYLSGSWRRLGELYDARGDTAAALGAYAKFVELWRDADAELQPLVRATRLRMRELGRTER